MNNNSKALKSGIWYTVGNFITKASAFLTVPIFTRILSSEDIGRFSNFTSWLGIFMIITTFEFCNSINVARFDFKEDLDDFIASNLIQGSLITSLFFGAFFIGFHSFGKIFSLTIGELLLLYLYCLTYPAVQMYQLKCRIDYKYKMSVFISLVSVLLSTFISLAFVITWENKYDGRFIGYTVPCIVINTILYFCLLLKAKELSIKKYWKYAMIISFPLIWHTLAGNVLTTSDRVMINYFHGSNSLALYSIAYSCASIVQILWMSMNSAWTPWAMEMLDQKKYEEINKALKPYCCFFGLVVFGFLLIAPEVLLFMGGRSYSSAISVIPPVMVSYVFNFAYSFYVTIEQYEKKQVIIARSTILAALINIGLNAIFIPRFGYEIAAYTTLVGYMALFLLHFLACVKMKKAKLVDNKFVFNFLLLFLVVMVLMNYFYLNTAIRFCVIGVIAISGSSFLIVFRYELLFLLRNKSISKLEERIVNMRKKK